MSQPKTFEELNYCINEYLQLHNVNKAEDSNSKELYEYHKGYVNGLEYAKSLIQNRKYDEDDQYKKKLEEANLTIKRQQKEIELWKEENAKDFFKFQQLLEAYINKCSC